MSDSEFPERSGVVAPRGRLSPRGGLTHADSRWRRALHAEWSDPVARGGLFLLVNTAFTALLGLIYWLIAARLYPQAAVGQAGALVSASTLLSGVGQLNLSGMLMRFLPQAGARSRRLVLTSYGIACGSSLLITLFAGIGVAMFTSRNSPLRLSPLEAALFSASVAATVVFTLQDSVLIAVRKTGWIPIENGGFGVAKILLLVAFVAISGWQAIFASWMLPLALTIPLITWLLFGRLLPRRHADSARRPIAAETKRQIAHFVLGDASAGIFTQAWTYLLPVIVTATLGARQDALFYTAFLFSSTLDQVAVNFSSPLVVAGARNANALPALVRASIRRTFIILVPLVLVFVAFAPLALHAYGSRYTAGAPALRLLALACLPKALLCLYYGVCRIRRQVIRSAAMQGVASVAILAGTVHFSGHGLATVAGVVLAVQVAVAIIAMRPMARLLTSPAD